MLSINTNLSSLIAQRSMSQATNSLDLAIERMSTGFKINHSRDNAAGYSISTNMTTKIGAYQVAEDNALMGLDMVTTASDTIGEMQNHAERLRVLATQARNGTFGKQYLYAMQEEANSIYAEINRLYSTANYNGVSLFNQSAYEIPDNMPQADPITGFIENPYDYTEDDLKSIESISNVTDFFVKSEYKIETVEDLVKLTDLTNNGVDTTGVTFILTNDLDLKEYCDNHQDEGGWTPIGNVTNTFKGSFNGNGHVISNLTINRPMEDKQGLFGESSSGSSIENIGLQNSSVKAMSNTACLIGHNLSIINNSYVFGDVSGKNNVGLLAGYSQKKVTSSLVEGTVQATGSWVGGVVGSAWCSIEDCYANIAVKGSFFVGGLAGYSSSYNTINKNNVVIGTVVGNSNVGGLFGSLYCPYDVKNIEGCCVYTEVIANSNNKGAFLGSINISDNGSSFGTVNIKNCKNLSQDMNLIGSVNVNGAAIDYDKSTWIDGIKKTNLQNLYTILHVGTKNELSSQIEFNSNFEYSLGKVVRFGIDSDSALSAIDEFINLLSEKQTALGAVQNRLDSVLEEISTQYENLVSSRSTIKDADISKVSSEYIKHQILQQASATLMATANQTPSIALQLI